MVGISVFLNNFLSVPYFFLVFFAVVGLLVGSFIGSITYRLPNSLSLNGRSFCPKCKAKIFWFDNIPLLSFFLLGGKCRFCKKRISYRYPLIEFFSSLCFILFFLLTQLALRKNLEPLSGFLRTFGAFSYFFFFVLLTSILVIVVIDIETLVVFDQVVFLTFLFSFLSYFLLGKDIIEHLFAGFLAASFFLLLAFLTGGKGLGYGDAKVALLIGFLLGLNLLPVFIFLSFLTGAIIGLMLVFVGMLRFKTLIPFTPFLFLGFFLTLFWGERFFSFLFS